MSKAEDRDNRPGSRSGLRLLLCAVLLPLLASCEEVIVTPAQVAIIQIEPDAAQVDVGGSVQLSAQLQDESGRPVRGHTVLWSSDDEGIATVDASGLVRGVASGTTTIHGQVGSAEATAVVRVRSAPTIEFNAGSVNFAMASGEAPPAPVDVAITSSGETELTGLSVAVTYSGASGWLSATLSRTTSPATLRIGVLATGLAPGSYAATVAVSAASAPGATASIAVSLEVAEEKTDPPQQPPSAPTNLAASFVHPNQIGLSWAPQGNLAREFRIERRIGSSSFTPLATVGHTSTTFVDTGLAAGEYRYRVQACNEAGCSGYSNQATVVIAPPSIVLSRGAVEFSMTRGGSAPAAVEVAITNGGDSPLTGLSVTTQYSGGAQNWLSATLSGNTAPAILTVGVVGASNLAAGRYEATVVVSASSASGTASLAVSLEVKQESAPPPQLPLSPTNLTAELTEPDRSRVSWTPQDDRATEFRVERRVGTSSFELRATVGGDNTTFSDGGLSADTRYTYRVRACNAAGCSDASNEATVETPPAQAPSPPTDLRAEIVQRNRVRLAWTNTSQSEPIVQIERALGSGSFSLLATTREGVVFYDDREVAAGTTYRYRVRACNSAGCSEPSNTITVATPD
jgi:hypothetical protein